jgi:DNA-binding transcriptional regulator GbsR (MarR family)|tara:strand:+ start:14360 stop:14899 length:540 start_codon:yes stop_codon:yes gene_type:complete
MVDLPPFSSNFILHWGEMGTKWGVNRTVAQIHALLFISEEPLNAEDICNRLGVARSNVSNSLKELQNWGIVNVIHLSGDRRDHFESVKDVYELFRIIITERKKREIDPTLRNLRKSAEEAGQTNDINDSYAKGQLEELLGFFEMVSDFYNQMDKMPTKSAVKIIGMGDKIAKTLGGFGK